MREACPLPATVAAALAEVDRAEAAGWPGDYAQAMRQLEALRKLAAAIREVATP